MRAGLLLGLALLLLAAVALGLLGSQAGLELALGAGARWLPGTLALREAHGSLLRGVAFSGLDYRSPGLDIAVGRGDCAWRARALLGARLHLPRCELEEVSVRTAAGGQGRTTLPESLRLPVALQFDALAVRRLRVEVVAEDGTASVHEVALVDGAMSLDAQGLELRRLRVEAPALGLEFLSLEGSVGGREPFPLALEADWRFRPPDGPALAGGGSLEGDLGALRLRQRLEQPAPATVELELGQPLEALQWRARVELPATAASALGLAREGLEVGADIQAEGALERASASLALRVADAEFGRWRAEARLGWAGGQALDIEGLSVQSDPGSATRLDAAGVASLGAAGPALRLQGSWEGLLWPLAPNGPVLDSPRGEFEFDGDAEAYTLALRGRIQAADLPETALDAALRGSPERVVFERFSAEGEWGRVEAGGALDIARLEVDLQGRWTGLRLPAAGPGGKPAAASPEGRFLLRGTPEAYRFELDGALAGEDFPAARVRVDGAGDSGALSLESIELQTLGGRLSGRATLALGEQPALSASLEGAGLDPGTHWKAWPGKLGFTLGLEGRLVDGRPLGTLELTALQGRLRGHALQGRGRAEALAQGYRVSELLLSSGRTRVRVDGVWGPAVDLKASVDSPDLGELWPAGGGRLAGTLTLGGAPAALRVEVDLTGEGVKAPGLALASLEADIAASLREDAPARLRLEASGVEFQGQRLERVSLTGEGSTGRHALALEAGGEPGSLSLALAGGLRGERWQGQLERATLEAPAAGRWELEAPAGLAAGRAALSLEQSCWRAADSARLCAEGTWQDDSSWRGRVSGERLPLARLPLPELPAGGRVEGLLSLEAEASGRGGWPSTGRFTLGGGPLSVILPEEARRPLPPFVVRRLALEAAIEDGRLGAALRLEPDTDLAEPVTGELRIPWPGKPVPWRELSVSGRLLAAVPDLGRFEPLAPVLADIRGQAQADLRVVGTLGEPELGGSLRLQGEADVPGLGIELRGVELTLSGAGERFRLHGLARSDPGTLRLQGEITPGAETLASVSLEGSRLKVLDTADGRVLVSPELTATLSGRLVDVRGTVVVPEATLTPGEMLQRASVSSDVVVLQEQPEGGDEPPLRTIATVKLVLGDAVKLASSGLAGRLTGDLLLIDRPGRATAGVGEIQLREGEFTFYGQTLAIERARFMFAGAAVDDPGLDVRASRKARDGVLAGVQMDGRVRDWRLKLFSEPPLRDEAILSYLALGRSLQGTGAADGSLLMQAASALGFRGGDRLVKGLSDTFGLDELSFGTVTDPSVSSLGRTDRVEPGTTQSAGLTLGKYLSPKLYVGYGFGVLTNANLFRLRYELAPGWSLEATSGAEQGADLLYSIER